MNPYSSDDASLQFNEYVDSVAACEFCHDDATTKSADGLLHLCDRHAALVAADVEIGYAEKDCPMVGGKVAV